MDEAQKKKILRQRLKENEGKLIDAQNKILELTAINKKLLHLIDFKETEARLQDNAIDRDNTIIHYLESKIVSMISDYNKN